MAFGNKVMQSVRHDVKWEIQHCKHITVLFAVLKRIYV